MAKQNNNPNMNQKGGPKQQNLSNQNKNVFDAGVQLGKEIVNLEKKISETENEINEIENSIESLRAEIQKKKDNLSSFKNKNSPEYKKEESEIASLKKELEDIRNTKLNDSHTKLRELNVTLVSKKGFENKEDEIEKKKQEEEKRKQEGIQREKINKEKAEALEIYRRQLNMDPTVTDNQRALSLKYESDSKKVIEQERNHNEKMDIIRNAIAEMLSTKGEHAHLTDEQKVLLSNPDEVDKVSQIMEKMKNDLVKKAEEANKKEAVVSALDEIKNGNDRIDVSVLADKMRMPITSQNLTQRDLELNTKYGDIVAKIIDERNTEERLVKEAKETKEKEELEIIEKIAKLEIENKALESGQEISSAVKYRKEINEYKAIESKRDGFKEIYFKSNKKEGLNDLTDLERKILDKYKNSIKEKVDKEKSEWMSLSREGKRALAMERLKEMIDKKKKSVTEQEFENLKVKSSDRNEIAGSVKRERYSKYAKQMKELLENKEYDKLKKLKAKNFDAMSYHDKQVLAAFETQEATIEKTIKATGPSGESYFALEKARRSLAESSREFATSHKKKLLGAGPIVSGIFGMVGIKNFFGLENGIKESDTTPEARKKMQAAQAEYEKIRKELIEREIHGDYELKKIWQMKAGDIALRMEKGIKNLSTEFIANEHARLQDLKHVFEGHEKKSAFQRFSKWYKEDYFKSIKNERYRMVAKRLTNAVVLGGAIAPFSAGVAGVYLGKRLLRAGVGGIFGESAAAGVARAFGGEKNEKGEFVKFAKDKAAAEAKVNEDFANAILEQIKKDQKPLLSPAIMDNVRKGHMEAVFNMQMREARIRKGEMWARILVGGGAGLATAQVFNDFGWFDDAKTAGIEVPKTNILENDGFTLEGDSVEASSRGTVATFMNLKKEMLAHYHGLNPNGTVDRYVEANEFAELDDEETVKKLLATGKFDDLTADILNAKTTEDFLRVASDHGFWKPEGAGFGNLKVDSASIPAGSRVGMEFDKNLDKMKLYILMPDGSTKIPLNDNFSEALGKYKGVGLINTDRFGGAPRMRPSMDRAVTTNIDSNMPDATNDDVPPPAPKGTNYIQDGYTNTNGPGNMDNGTDSVWDKLENDYLRKWKSLNGDYWSIHPYSDEEFYSELKNKGFEPVKGYNTGIVGSGGVKEHIFYFENKMGNRFYTDYYLYLNKTNSSMDYPLESGYKTLADFPYSKQNYDKWLQAGGNDMHYKMVDETYANSKTDPINAENIRNNTNMNGQPGNNTTVSNPGQNVGNIPPANVEDLYTSNKAAQEWAKKQIDGEFGKTFTNGNRSKLWLDLKQEKMGHIENSLAGRESLAYDQTGDPTYDGQYDYYSANDLLKVNDFYKKMLSEYRAYYPSIDISNKTMEEIVQAVALRQAK